MLPGSSFSIRYSFYRVNWKIVSDAPETECLFQTCEVWKCEAYSMGKMKNIIYMLRASHFQWDSSNFFLIPFCRSLATTCWNFSICDYVPHSHSAVQFWVPLLLIKWKDKPTYEALLCWSYLQSGPWFDQQFSYPLHSPFVEDIWNDLPKDKVLSDTYIPHTDGCKPCWNTVSLVGF